MSKTLRDHPIIWLSSMGMFVGLLGVMSIGSEAEPQDPGYTKPAIEALGTKSGSPIHSGFVFVDGAYVDSPYIVSRRGVKICINGVVVATPLQWPPMDYEDKKPEMPKGLNKKSTLKDLEIPNQPGNSLDRQMIRWLRRHYEDAEAKERIIKFYKSIPFVKEVSWDREIIEAFNISTWSGKTVTMYVGGPVYRPAKPAEYIERLEEKRTRLEKRLKEGDCFFLFSAGGELSFGSRKATIDLAAIVRAFRSNKTKDQKIKTLQMLGVYPPEFSKKWEILVTNFSASSQLEERIKQLKLPPGDKGKRRPTPEEERERLDKMMTRKAAGKK